MTVANPTLDLPPAKREIFRPRKALSIGEFARRHIRITEGPMVGDDDSPVEWSTEAFSLQQTVIEAIEDRRWARVFLMTSPQAFGKTLCAALPTLLHALHHRRVSAAYVAATLNLAVTQYKKKILKTIEADDQLSMLLFGNVDFGGTKERRDFVNGTSLHCAGADSAGALSAFTTPVVVCDDLQAYPATLPGFGHPADIAWKRSEAYPAELITHVGIGTAGTVDDYLWRAMKDSALFLPFVPCPRCAAYQLLHFDRLLFDHSDVDAALAGAVIPCAGCEHPIRFADLPGMLRSHLWISCPPDADWVMAAPSDLVVDPAKAEVYPATRRNTNIAGFWCNALYWPLGKAWGERAAEFVEIAGDADSLKDHQQHVAVIPWDEPEIDEERLTTEEVETHIRGEYVAGTVPATADCLTCTVDVQSGYVYYLFRAWRIADGTSWLIALGTCGRPIRGPSEQTIRERRLMAITAALDDVEALARAGFDVADDQGQITGQIDLKLGLIDRGFEPDIVAGWWSAKHRRVWRMIRGAKAGHKPRLWPAKPTLDDRRRPYRDIDVNQAKHLVRKLQRIGPDQPGYWHLPTSGLHPNTVRAYARHLASERFNRELRTPRWEKITPGMANHFWDCEVYQVCAAVALGVHLPVLERQPESKAVTGYAKAGDTEKRSANRWRIGR